MTHRDGAVGADGLHSGQEAIRHARSVGGSAWEGWDDFRLDRVRPDDVIITIGDQQLHPPFPVACRRHLPAGTTVTSADGRTLEIADVETGQVWRPLR